MLTRIRLYREYRRQGMRRAWTVAGMTPVALSLARSIGILMIAIGAYGVTSDQVEAVSVAADNRVAARLANQDSEIHQLRLIVAACLGDQDGALFVGGELHMCRAVPTGVRK